MLTQIAEGKDVFLSECQEDLKFLENAMKEKRKNARFMKGVSLCEQKKRVARVQKAATKLQKIAKQCMRSLTAKEKRIWGNVEWMNQDDKEQSDLMWKSRKQKEDTA